MVLICKHGATPKSTCVLCRREAERNRYNGPELLERQNKWQAAHPDIPLDKLTIKDPAPPRKSVTLSCPSCQKVFERQRPWQKYCSNNCRYKAHSYPYQLTSEQRKWKLQHMAEMRKSNPEYFRARDERYRDTHYILNGRTIYTYGKDPILDYEMTHDTPIRVFIPIPEKYADNPAQYFRDGIIMLDRIQKRTRRSRQRLRA